MNSLSIAVILGIVEGLTEFLPVSSTGHLIIAGNLLGFVGAKADSFDVAIQMGAILSVVLLYWRRFLGLLPGTREFADAAASRLNGWPGLCRIALATVPALAVGFLARHAIKEKLFNPEAVTLALLVGGLAILLVERYVQGRRGGELDGMTLTQALGIGLFQTLALWPGTSRSAVTIIGGMLLGLERRAAAEFSFLIAVPVLCAASGYELIKMHDQLRGDDLLALAIGGAVSFVVALAAIKGFVRYLSHGRLAPFAWYRILVAPVFYWLTRGTGF